MKTNKNINNEIIAAAESLDMQDLYEEEKQKNKRAELKLVKN